MAEWSNIQFYSYFAKAMTDLSAILPVTLNISASPQELQTKEPAKTVGFLTPNPLKKSFICSECPSSSQGKKYPESWKLYVLPEFKQKSLSKTSARSLQPPSHMRSSMMTYKEKLMRTPQTGEPFNKNSRSITQDSDANEEDGMMEKLLKAQKRVEEEQKRRKQAIEAEKVNPPPAVQKHQQWTGRIVLENEYQREEADYLRQMFMRCLIRKYKPDSQTLN